MLLKLKSMIKLLRSFDYFVTIYIVVTIVVLIGCYFGLKEAKRDELVDREFYKNVINGEVKELSLSQLIGLDAYLGDSVTSYQIAKIHNGLTVCQDVKIIDITPSGKTIVKDKNSPLVVDLLGGNVFTVLADGTKFSKDDVVTYRYTINYVGDKEIKINETLTKE